VGVPGKVEIFPKYQAGLKDIDGFSHIILIYFFHKSTGYKLETTPFMDTVKRGLFSTRAPKRPNPIGLSVVKLDRVEDGILHVLNVDVLDGTPLLDIKPYVPEFDSQEEVITGWLEKTKKGVSNKKSDDRFLEDN
jgi:tRNA-Thr(GGU) m(6)t(6)A37 methyltransferase TsaA